mgnify:CR=1 FL=1
MKKDLIKGKKKLLETKEVKILEEKLSHIKTPVTLSIIGCVVNGPGEAAMTDIGITGGGKGNNMLYLSGIQKEKILSEDNALKGILHLLDIRWIKVDNKEDKENLALFVNSIRNTSTKKSDKTIIVNNHNI